MFRKMIPAFVPAQDIRFSKCFGEDGGDGRNRLKFGIHASVSAFQRRRAAELLGTSKTLTKSNILRKSQMPESFCAASPTVGIDRGLFDSLS